MVLTLLQLQQRKKPIICAIGELNNDCLSVIELIRWDTFLGFEAFIESEDSKIVAVDFPLGQPLKLVKELGWQMSWHNYVDTVAQMSKEAFEYLIKQYRDSKPKGSKHLLRETDKLAGSCSPMMLYGVPVGKMFFEGATRLQASSASIWPCRVTNSNCFIIEGYPALVTRYLNGRRAYKSESMDTPSRMLNRRSLVEKLLEPDSLKSRYKISLNLSKNIIDSILNDPKGDVIDAVLCAIQAANFHISGIGKVEDIPKSVVLEGWISDPTINERILK